MTRGKNNKFLVMNINITEDKQVEIEMKDKFLEAIEEFGENINEQVTTPPYSHLFIVNQQANQLDE